MRRLVAASNDWARLDALMETMRRGPEGSSSLKVRDARGVERMVKLQRSLRYDDTSAFARPAREFTYSATGAIRVINAVSNGNPTTISLADSRAVLVDLRGKVTDAGYNAVRRVLPSTSQMIARIVRRGSSRPCNAPTLRVAQLECTDERSTATTFASGDGSDGSYNGLLVAHVDERTDARGEWLAMMLETAGARIVGNSTIGALSRSSWLRVPGGLEISIPIEEVRRADGGQLHRVGLTPLMEFRPTIKSLRDGTDGVLDRTLQWIRQEIAPPVRRR
jgi:C-terminal processing protease CtpA/Prc